MTSGTPATERKRQQRERERVAKRQTLFSRTDWSFLNPRTISQKAGCQPNDLRKLALRELVDNGADAGAKVIIYPEGDGWIISDDGPGLDPDDVPHLFSVNRTLVSSKQLRLPTRGMVGNGLRVVMGAVAVFEGNLTVTTRGRRMRLAVDPETGLTVVTEDTAVSLMDGMTVFISLPGDNYGYGSLATETVRLAEFGRAYKGPTSPHWYAARDLRDLMQQAPEETTVADVADWFGIDLPDERLARELDPPAAAQLLSILQLYVPLVQAARLGEIGEAAYKDTFYHKVNGFTRTATSIPYVCEAWATCRRSEQRGAGSARVKLLLNRTVSTAQLTASSGPQGVLIQGCGILRRCKGKTGHYDITLSVISPYIELATDGKEPALAPFGEGFNTVVEKACAKAHHAMDKPPGSMTIIEAAEQVMPKAYLVASANGTRPPMRGKSTTQRGHASWH